LVELRIRIHSGDGKEDRSVQINDLIIAGWAGRDREATEHHIVELEALGIARPRTTPMFYTLSASRLTTSPQLQAVGDASSGEVECVLLALEGALYVGVGSDHTDRRVEAYGVTVSKQICDKPIGTDFWPLADVIDHWDELKLISDARIGGELVRYQEGSVSALIEPLELLERLGGGLADGTAMFCGTLPALGGIRPSEQFIGKLHDPVLSRTLEVRYQTSVLTIAD
jgi:hypothetical protein